MFHVGLANSVIHFFPPAEGGIGFHHFLPESDEDKY
jgi:hypothetical protein